MIYRALTFLGLLLLFSSTLQAQTPSPATWAEQPLYILVLDSEGRWDSDRQGRFELAPGLRERTDLSSDWKRLVDTRPFRRLSYADRLALLAYPERLLASSWAKQYFAARHVMVLRPLSKEEDRIEGRLFDLARGRDWPLILAPGLAGVEARVMAVEQALQEVALSREAVLAHPEGLYHREGAPHLSEQAHYERVESPARAEAFGLRPCGICYPQAARDPLYDDLDRSLGELVATQIEGSFPVATAGEQTQRVQAIGERLLSDNRFLDQGYQFRVLEVDTVNAYAAPTGPIYVTTGLLKMLESDDELAAVLGHELSHSERKHARQQYERAQKAAILGMGMSIVTGFPLASLGTEILSTVLVRGYNRGYELEADRDGMMAAYGAGYDPAHYVNVQDKLERLDQESAEGEGAEWLQTHPGGDQRREQLHEILERTAPVRARLQLLEASDPGLARYLKGQVLTFSENFAALEVYLAHYETFAATVDRTAPPGPRARDPLPLAPAVPPVEGDAGEPTPR